MPAPVLESFAQRLYDGVEPLAFDDANQGYALALYLGALGTMFQIVEDYARDQVLGSVVAPGWSQLVDIDRCPTEALPWLAQFVGVITRAGLSDAAQRDRIRSTSGWTRGTVGAIVGAAQQYLAGSKTVILRERDPAACAAQPAYGLTVITYTAETPSSANVLAALLEQKPAGIVLNYQVLTGEDYQSLLTNHPLYSNVFADFATYQGVATATPGT